MRLLFLAVLSTFIFCFSLSLSLTLSKAQAYNRISLSTASVKKVLLKRTILSLSGIELHQFKKLGKLREIKNIPLHEEAQIYFLLQS